MRRSVLGTAKLPRSKSLISISEGKILEALNARDTRHGYEMSQSEGIHVKTIYKSLKLLERKGLVSSRPAGDGRVLYEITPPGRELAVMLVKTDLIQLVENGKSVLATA